jgi:hypothetical protein
MMSNRDKVEDEFIKEVKEFAYLEEDKLNPKYIKWLEDRVFKTIGKDIINSDEYTYLLRCEKELNNVSE